MAAEPDQVPIAHEAGLPFVFHSDGKLWEVIPDLIAVGVTCYVRPENYHAMRQAVFEYGKYPIQL